MNRTIILPSNSIGLLKESQEEVTFFEFFNEIKKFIAKLLDDPINAMPSDFLVSHGFNCKDLKNKLISLNIIKRNESIDEPVNEDGEAESTYHVSYKVPKQGFKRKIRRLYQNTFET